MVNRRIDIIIPVKNEAHNIEPLCRRVDTALSHASIDYRLIFVVDPSTDGTEDKIAALQDTYPIVLHTKKGRVGKAYSLLEGAAFADAEYIAMIDGDLQYPPEAIPAMLEETQLHGVVIAERISHEGGLFRRFLSRLNTFLFGRALFGASYDFQSGLKVFRRYIIDHLDHSTIRPWSFDIPLLHTALELGHTIGSVPIMFEERTSGQSKVRVFSAAYQIIRSALLVRMAPRQVYRIDPHESTSMIGAGVSHKRKTFITHTTLPTHHSALVTFHAWQKALGIGLVITFFGGLLISPVPTLIVAIACISIIYFVDTVFHLGLVLRSLRRPTEVTVSEAELAQIDDEKLPVYSILCPLYKEAAVVPLFLKSLEKLEWPQDKLEVLFLLEETDEETIIAIENLDLPKFVRIVVVPDSQPRTKPKACNYGLNIAQGEYVVIYDAEDKPDPWQLKKAYLAFKKVPSDVFCLQAKLNYYNSEQNLLTRLFSAEYSLWFDVMLTGLQSMAAIIPLGGTSNHFRAKDLQQLHGWDPFNVTEDCDLGARLFKAGYKTAIIDSVTLEEANSQLWNWVRQRSRWIKGYMQTYLVHMRNPILLWKKLGMQAFIFQLVVGGKLAFMLINPLLWIATIVYFTFRSTLGPVIEQLYPPFVFYLAAFSLIFGNFLYIYYYMIGCAKREKWSLIKYVFLVPLYWVCISFAALIAFWQLLTKPHYWEKTNHGLHLYAKKGVKHTIANSMQAVKRTSGKVWSNIFVGSGLLLAGMMAANVVNFLFNAYLGRTANLAQVSVVALVSTFWNIALLFFGAYAAAINHAVAFLAARNEDTRAHAFRWQVGVRAFGIILIAAVAWLVATPFLNEFFHITQQGIVLSAVPIFVLGIVLYTNIGYFEGKTWFGIVGALYVVEAVSKFVAAVVFAQMGREDLLYLVVPISVAVSAIAALLAAWVLPKGEESSQATLPKFPLPFFAASLLAGVSATIFTSIDIVLAKHYLEASVAGEYALLALFGKIIFFLGSLPSALIVTFTSRSEALKTNSIKVFLATFLGTSALVGVGLILLGPLGPFTATILLGERAAYVLPYLTGYAIAMALFTLSNTVVLYHVARKRYFLAVASLLQALFVVLALQVFHGSVHEIVEGMIAAGIASFVVIFSLQLTTRAAIENIQRLYSDLKDLIVFRTRLRKRLPEKMRILIFNWRDLRHVHGGGAEKYIQDMAKQWAVQGHAVTLFCGNDGQSPRMEYVNGVQVIRRGGFYLVYLWAFLYYVIRFRMKYDVIVDCHNGVPFFTPLYVRKPIFLLVHHVHQEVFAHSLIGPLARIATFMEQTLMPYVYRKIKVITVSDSSKKDIERLGMGASGIEVVHPGVDVEHLAIGEKEETPLVVYLGRLKKYKSLDVLLRAFARVLEEVPTARLMIAGEGEELEPLKALMYSLRIQRAVVFLGKVTNEQKVDLLQRAWVVVNPSLKEGWGITTIEANACGTPVVASDVPGLRDSVQDNNTGCLVPYGDDAAFAAKLVEVLENTSLRTHMSESARQWSLQFDTSAASKRFLTIIYGKG